MLFCNIPKSVDIDIYRAVSFDPRLRVLDAEGHELPGGAPAETAVRLGVPGQRAAVPVKKELPVLLSVKNKTWLLEVFYEPEYVINDERYPGNANQF